jgi:hypothetical protein
LWLFAWLGLDPGRGLGPLTRRSGRFQSQLPRRNISRIVQDFAPSPIDHRGRRRYRCRCTHFSNRRDRPCRAAFGRGWRQLAGSQHNETLTNAALAIVRGRTTLGIEVRMANALAVECPVAWSPFASAASTLCLAAALSLVGLPNEAGLFFVQDRTSETLGRCSRRANQRKQKRHHSEPTHDRPPTRRCRRLD